MKKKNPHSSSKTGNLNLAGNNTSSVCADVLRKKIDDTLTRLHLASTFKYGIEELTFTTNGDKLKIHLIVNWKRNRGDGRVVSRKIEARSSFVNSSPILIQHNSYHALHMELEDIGYRVLDRAFNVFWESSIDHEFRNFVGVGSVTVDTRRKFEKRECPLKRLPISIQPGMFFEFENGCVEEVETVTFDRAYTQNNPDAPPGDALVRVLRNAKTTWVTGLNQFQSYYPDVPVKYENSIDDIVTIENVPYRISHQGFQPGSFKSFIAISSNENKVTEPKASVFKSRNPLW